MSRRPAQEFSREVNTLCAKANDVSVSAVGLELKAVVEQFRSSTSMGVWGALAGVSDMRALAALTAPVRLFRRGEPLALMPFAFVR